MIALQDLIDSAAFRADMTGTDRVLQGEWVKLLREAINSAWNLAAAARPDFQFTSSDFALASGGSASVDTRTFKDFHSLIDVVFSPDTSNEYSLGPFAWQNRRSPGGWMPYDLRTGGGYGGSRASLRGFFIYVEPSLQAAGSYRAWYCPKAHAPNVIVRLATTAALPACTAAGAGVGKTLTANANGALSVDSQPVALNDRVLVKNQAATGDNGVYVVTAIGDAGTRFVLVRAIDFDETTELAVGDIVAVGQTNPALPVGVLNEKKFYTLSTFTAIEAAMVFSEGAVLEQILEQFQELIALKTCIPAMMRDGGTAATSVADFQSRLDGNGDGRSGLVFEMKQYFAVVRSVGPQRMIDTDQIGVGAWRAGLG